MVMRPIMISPLGEPGSGKSTFSLGLCHALNKAGIQAEFVPEVIKHDVFTAQGVARVTSGHYDSRYLRLQHAAALGFLEQAEVIVNDGSLEPFFFYGRNRVPAPRFAAYEALLERFRCEQSKADHRFVSLELELPYQATGRHQDQVAAKALRAPLLETLNQRFGIHDFRFSPSCPCFADAVMADETSRRKPHRVPANGRQYLGVAMRARSPGERSCQPTSPVQHRFLLLL